MDKSRIKQLLPLVGSKLDISQNRTGWVIATCPYAPWKHKNGIDKNPSFGIKINNGGLSSFNCFSCNSHGDLEDLVLDLKFWGATKDSGYQLGAALQLIALEEDDAALDIPDYEDSDGEISPNDKVVFFSESWLAGFKSATNFQEALDYLKSRGLSHEDAVLHDLRYDTLRRRVCFPIRDWDGNLIGLHGRDITGHAPYPYHAYKHNNHWNKIPWCGEHLIDPDEPVVLCESVFDYAKIKQVLPNVLCSLSAGLSYLKCKRVSFFPEVVTFYDYGTGGDAARAALDKYLPESVVTHVIPTEEQGDPGAMKKSEIWEALLEYLP